MLDNQQDAPKPRRGFAALSPEKRRQIAQKGGRAAQDKGVAHKWTSEQAKVAGKKGGQAYAESRILDREFLRRFDQS